MINIFFLNLTLTNKNYGNPILSPVLGGRGRSPEGVYNLNKVTIYATTHDSYVRNPPPQANCKQVNLQIQLLNNLY